MEIKGKCYICGQTSKFVLEKDMVLLREAKCEFCGAMLRNSDLAKAIVHVLFSCNKSIYEMKKSFENLKIFNANSSGPVHEMLHSMPNYVSGEYMQGVISGHVIDGKLCVDLMNMPFSDKMFDLVISEDVLEHVDDIDIAFGEINRVLKVDGYHIFTVPLHEGRCCQSRKNLNEIYHGDYLVVTDFGDNIDHKLEKFGMNARVMQYHKFYCDDEITNIDEIAQYNEYVKCYERYKGKEGYSAFLNFYKYNSNVIVAKKEKNCDVVRHDSLLLPSGERFIPEKFGNRASGEHLQRYRAVSKFISNKIVLDAACGDGYGSNILSETAAQVTGFDISPDAICLARMKYKASNLKYEVASIESLPVEDNSVDVIISFETIEHVPEEIQEKFLKEIKRVLKKDGVLIISTPDKKYHTDIPNQINEFHIKEFYENEFYMFLKSYFSSIDFYYQGLKNYLTISQKKKWESYLTETRFADIPQFIIAVCSEQKIINLSLGSIVPIESKANLISLLYVDYGKGFNEKNTIASALKIDNKNFIAKFEIPGGINVKGLRWDPFEGYYARIKINRVWGDKNYSVKCTNADRKIDGYDDFLTIDPIYVLDGDFTDIRNIYIEGCFDLYTDQGLYDVFNKQQEYQRELMKNKLQEKEAEWNDSKNIVIAERDKVMKILDGIYNSKGYNLLLKLYFIRDYVLNIIKK